MKKKWDGDGERMQIEGRGGMGDLEVTEGEWEGMILLALRGGELEKKRNCKK